MTSERRALFLDRDGVINVDKGHVHTREEFELVPDGMEVIRWFQERGHVPIVVTNQAGIAKGYYTEAEFLAFDAWMRSELALRHGIRIAQTYYSPYHPAGTVARYARASDCRKPGNRLIERAIADHGFDRGASVLIGDKPSDIEAGRSSGIGQLILLAPGVAPVMDACAAYPSMSALLQDLRARHAGRPQSPLPGTARGRPALPPPRPGARP